MANRIKGITVEIGGDTTGLDKALKSVNSSITKTQSALNDVNRLLKLDPSNTVLVAQKQELLAQAISQTEEKLSALEAAQEQVAAAFARGDIGADKYQAFQREIEETRGKLNKYNQKEVDPLLGSISETAPSNPEEGDFWYQVDHSAQTVTLMKYSGSAWAAATEKQSLTYTWYAQDKDGHAAEFDKAGKVIYLSAADIDSILTLQCDVSN